MALGDYILCCECECKLIYDGDRDKREWWHDRWGKEPQIKCPDCETPQRKPLTDEEIDKAMAENKQKLFDTADNYIKMRRAYARIIEAAHGIKGEA
jgi:hypothetical protein